MAKDCHHPNPTFRKPTTKPNHDSSKAAHDDMETGRGPEHNSRLCKESPDAPLKLRNMVASIDKLEYPITIKDGNDRIWLLKNALSQPVECTKDSQGVTHYLCCSALDGKFNALNRNIIEENVGKYDLSGCCLHRQPSTVNAGREKSEPGIKKRVPSAIQSSPSKRRVCSSPSMGGRSSYIVLEDQESDTTEADSEEEEDEFAGVTFENQGVRISEIQGTMVDILKKLQQKGLKQVLKAVLRKCHPQKQASFPYNGGKHQEQKRLNGDPDYDERNPGLLTAPDYWLHQDDWKPDHGRTPTGCRHREPDHIYKPERINLTMHLLHAGNRFSDAKFGLDKLRESTLNITSDYPKEFQPDAERLIEALYYAREKEIQYENGEIDAETVVYVPMPAVRPAKPKRTTRRKKGVTKVKQDTIETSGFFELGTPINPSPSANSSFTAAFNDTIKVESGSSSPCSIGLPPRNTDDPSSHTALKRLAFQACSYPLKSASEGLDTTHSDNTSPTSSGGDTEAATNDEILDANQRLQLGQSQSLNPYQGPQLAPHDMNNLGPVVTMTTTQPPTPAVQANSTVPHGLPDYDHHNGRLHHSLTSGPENFAPIYINPADTYRHAPGDNFARCDYTSNSTNAIYSNFAPLPTDYQAFLDPRDNHPMPLNPMTNHSIGHPPLLTGYPSSASSDFNGAMPVDPDWHAVDLSNEHFHDGTYQQQQQQQQQQQGLPLASTAGSSAVQHGDTGNERRFWASEFDAMAHEPGRFTAQQRRGGMSVTRAEQQVVQQQHQPPQSSYPFLSHHVGQRRA